MRKCFYISFFMLNIILSGQENYSTIYEVSGNYDEIREINIIVIKDGMEEYSFSKILPPHYSIPKITVLANGNILLVFSLEGRIEIFNGKGDKLLFEEFYFLPPYREQNLVFDINEEGFIIISSEKRTNKFYRYNNIGDRIFESKLLEGNVTGITSSKKGKLFGYGLMNWENEQVTFKTVIFNQNNKMIIDLPLQYQKGDFDSDESYFLGQTNKQAFCVDLRSNRIKWMLNQDNGKILIDSFIGIDGAVLAEADNPVLINKKWMYDNIRVIQKKISGEESSPIEIDRIGSDVKLKFNEGMSMLEIDGEIISLIK